ncbi:hypothetical protein DEAC_c42650 [Desulfosporosinus acididurans]|uniref:Uncharacterized protein n=1 Tax=Desulfosporosinus acididurans TaxID=476652 RepID=A0A0J1FK08_9FIRM|nr:hypothetical protein [Desulfosporosinus acididurans]KLU63809.1 hypothetical protein DEAC_c42650 [Desulfosporosinus acididurans]
MGLKEEIKASALNLGADLVGVASVERFDGAPSGFHPTDIMPETKSVVVIAKKISDQLVCGSLGTAYTNTFQAILRRLDYIASDVAVFVEKVGGKAIPIPADDPYNYWDEENHRGMRDLSSRDK